MCEYGSSVLVLFLSKVSHSTGADGEEAFFTLGRREHKQYFYCSQEKMVCLLQYMAASILQWRGGGGRFRSKAPLRSGISSWFILRDDRREIPAPVLASMAPPTGPLLYPRPDETASPLFL